MGTYKLSGQSKKNSGAAKIAAMNAKSSSSSSKPKVATVSEEERKANMMITGDAERMQGVDRTRATLADIEAAKKAGQLNSMQQAMTPTMFDIKPNQTQNIMQPTMFDTKPTKKPESNMFSIKSVQDLGKEFRKQDPKAADAMYTSLNFGAGKVNDVTNDLSSKYGSAKTMLDRANEKASKHILTLDEVQQKGSEFRDEHPKIANAMYKSLDFGARAVRSSPNKDVETLGTFGGHAAVGFYDEFEKKPATIAATTVGFAALPGAIGVAGKAAGVGANALAATTVGSKVVKYGAPITSRIPTGAVVKAGELGLGGAFAYQMEKEITAPGVTEIRDSDGKLIDTITTKPSLAEMGHRTGELFAKEVLPASVGLGLSSGISKFGKNAKAFTKDKFDFAIVKKTEPQEMLLKTEMNVEKQMFSDPFDEAKIAKKRATEKAEKANKKAEDSAQSEMSMHYTKREDVYNYDVKEKSKTFLGEIRGDVADVYTRIPAGKESELAKLFDVESAKVRRIRTKEGSFIEVEPVNAPYNRNTAFSELFKKKKTAKNTDKDIRDVEFRRLNAGPKQETIKRLGKVDSVYKKNKIESFKDMLDDINPYRIEKKVDINPIELKSIKVPKNNIINVRKQSDLFEQEFKIGTKDELELLGTRPTPKMLAQGEYVPPKDKDRLFEVKSVFDYNRRSMKTVIEEVRPVDKLMDAGFDRKIGTIEKRITSSKPDKIFGNKVIEKPKKNPLIRGEDGMFEQKTSFSPNTKRVDTYFEKYSPYGDKLANQPLEMKMTDIMGDNVAGNDIGISKASKKIDDVIFRPTSENIVRQPIKEEGFSKTVASKVDTDDVFKPQKQRQVIEEKQKRTIDFAEPTKVRENKFDAGFKQQTKGGELANNKESDMFRSKSGKSSKSDDMFETKKVVSVKPEKLPNTLTMRTPIAVFKSENRKETIYKSKQSPVNDPFKKPNDTSKPDAMFGTSISSRPSTEVNPTTETKVKEDIFAKTSTKTKAKDAFGIDGAGIKLPPTVKLFGVYGDDKESRMFKTRTTKKGKVMRVVNKLRSFEDEIR